MNPNEVRYCDDERVDRRAQIVKTNEDGTADLALYDDAGHILGGVSNARRAVTPEDRIVPGRFW